MSERVGREWFGVDIDGATFLFDLTFLASAWQCIFGAGCQGVRSEPTPELGEGCCSYGAHLVDEADRDRVAAAAARLTPDDWANHGTAPDDLFVPDGDDLTTALIDDVCAFHNPPDFPGGHGCALHIGALRNDQAPLTWKPDVCWQLPLRLDDHEDDNGHHTYLLREWKRRDWGDEGAALHWWCTEDPASYGSAEPVYRHLSDEIISMVGPAPYAALVAHLEARATTVLPHPARRRRADGS